MNQRTTTLVIVVLALVAGLGLLSACTRPMQTNPIPTPINATPGNVPPTSRPQQVVTPTLSTPIPQPTVAPVQPAPLPTVAPVQPAPQPTAAQPNPVPPAQPNPITPAQPPAQPGTAASYTVKPGDRLFSIGREFGVSPYAIAQANGIVPPYVIHAGQILTIPAGAPGNPPPGGQPGTYTIKRGDTIYSIARQLGKSPAAIISANGLANPNCIFAGQTLRIP